MDDLGALAWKSVGLKTPPSTQIKTLNGSSVSNNSSQDLKNLNSIPLKPATHAGGSTFRNTPSSSSTFPSAYTSIQSTHSMHKSASQLKTEDFLTMNSSSPQSQSPLLKIGASKQTIMSSTKSLDPFSSLLEFKKSEKPANLNELSVPATDSTMANQQKSWDFDLLMKKTPLNNANSLSSLNNGNSVAAMNNVSYSHQPSSQNAISHASISASTRTVDVFDIEFLESNTMQTRMDETPVNTLKIPVKDSDLSPVPNGKPHKPSSPLSKVSYALHQSDFDLQKSMDDEIYENVDSNEQSHRMKRFNQTRKDQLLARLMEAGFPLDAASTALKLTGNDYSAALLMLQQNSAAELSIQDHSQHESAINQQSLGLSFMSTAKQVLTSSKKKLGQVVEKAQERLSKPNRGMNSIFGVVSAPSARRTTSASKTRILDSDSSFEDFSEIASGSSTPKYPAVVSQEVHSAGNTTLHPGVNSPIKSTANPTNMGLNTIESTSKHFNNPSVVQQSSHKSVVKPSSHQSSQEPSQKPLQESAARKTQNVTATPSQLDSALEYKERGNSSFKAGQYANAADLYTSGIQVLPNGNDLLVTLHNNRASAYLKTGEFHKVVHDSTFVLQVTSDKQQDFKAEIAKSLLRRALAFENMEKWTEAKQDYTNLLSIEQSKAIHEGIARCQKADQIHLQKSTHASQAGNKATFSRMQEQSLDPFGVGSDLSFSGESFEASNAKSRTIPPMNALNSTKQSINSSSHSTQPIKLTESIRQLRLQETQAEELGEQQLALQDIVDAKLQAWVRGKEANVRALLASLDDILWPTLGLPRCNLGDLIQPNQVKIKYMKAIARIHPDKVSSKDSYSLTIVVKGRYSGTKDDRKQRFYNFN